MPARPDSCLSIPCSASAKLEGEREEEREEQEEEKEEAEDEEEGEEEGARRLLPLHPVQQHQPHQLPFSIMLSYVKFVPPTIA